MLLLQTTLLVAQKPNNTATNSTGQQTTGNSQLGTQSKGLYSAVSSNRIQTSKQLSDVSVGGDAGANGSNPSTTLSTCPLMYVNVDILYLQSCVSTPTRISYCNHGTATATNVYIEVTLDSVLTLDSATVSYTSLGANQYRFDVGTVVDSTCGGFDIFATTDCDTNLLNQTYCVEAKIYPDTICSDVWNHYVLTSDATCFGDSILFELKNHGSTVSYGSQVRFIIIDDHLLINGQHTILKQGAVQLMSGESKFLSLDRITAGGQYRLEILDANDDLISSTSISNCQSANTSQAIIYNNTTQQFWNGSSVPSVDKGCSINGIVPSTSMAGGAAGSPTESIVADVDHQGIEEVNEDQKMEVRGIRTFPNPFTDYTTIVVDGDFPAVKQLDLFVYDVAGRQVAFKQVQNQTTIELERGNLKTGIYLFRLEVESQLVGTGKLIVQ
jgi:hypothetical protein